MDIYHILELLLVPITSVVTWLATRNKRRNDAIGELQTTIDMLVKKNGSIYQDLINTRKELSEAWVQIEILKTNTDKLLVENAELKKLIEGKKK
ncbi:MAG: hypothetical protein IKM99_09155 [Bacteroidales bacterium]|nr:hypothetical protein [Bacteroidales bacterium]